MLEFIRERAQGWMAWVIVILICIPFALFGINSYFGTDPNAPVIIVDDAEIGLIDFQRAYQNDLATLRNRFGNQFDQNLLDQTRLKQLTVERLVQAELVSQLAVRDGLRIGEAQLVRVLRGQENFQEGNRFSPSRYQNWLQSQGYTSARFEGLYKGMLLSQQLRSGIEASHFSTSRDKEQLTKLISQVRDFSLLRITSDMLPASTVADEATLAEYYSRHQEQFRTTERLKLHYLLLSSKELAAGVAANEEALRDLYEAQKLDYVVPEQRSARHLLIALKSDADEKAIAESLQRISALREQILAGASFAKLATAHSDDPGSSKQGGDLGSFSRDVMEPEFEKAAFALRLGELSEPVRSAFGFHLIQLDAIEAEHGKRFADVRDELLVRYRSEEAEKILYEQVERLATLAFENPDSLEVAVDELGLELKKSGWVERDGMPGDAVLGDLKLLAAAFSDDVLEAKNNSEVLELADGSFAVLRVAEHSPPTVRKFDQVRGEIIALLQSQDARKRLEERGHKALQALNKGSSRESVAIDLGARWEVHKALTRHDLSLDQNILQRVFRMSKSTSESGVFDGLPDNKGDFVVIALSRVGEQPADSEGARNQQAALESLLGKGGDAEYRAYLQSLRNSAEVVIYQDRL